ncbi:hypothetical protein LMG1864_01872 [Achromobacter ruhlandii]|nr:hypothetical protein LMG1864_01872 [Achromobacter ruhlandii]
MLSLSGGLWCSFGRPWRRRPAGRGATIAVRSVRSGLPRCQPRTPSAPYGFPRAHLHAPRPAGRRRHGLRHDHFTGAGANRVLGVLVEDRVGTEDWAGPPKPAARAAGFGIWGEVGRDAEESERQRRRYYVWKNPGCIGCCLPWKGSGMHRALSSVERIRDASGVLLPWKDPRCIAGHLPRQPFFPSIRRAPSSSRASHPPSRAATLFPPSGRHLKQATRHPRAAPTRQAKTPRKLRAAARAATRNGHQQSREVSSLLQRHRPRKT